MNRRVLSLVRRFGQILPEEKMPQEGPDKGTNQMQKVARGTGVSEQISKCLEEGDSTR
jgi:hypothetical protein